MLKLFIACLCVGVIDKLDTPIDFDSQKDFVKVLILLYTILIPEGNYYGGSIVITMGAYLVLGVYQITVYNKLRDKEVKELAEQKSIIYYSWLNAEIEIKDMQEELIELREFKLNTHKKIYEALVQLNQQMYHRVGETDDNEIIQAIVDLMELYNQPIVVQRKLSPQLFSNLNSRFGKKMAIRKLKLINLECDFGKGFESEIENYIKILEEEVRTECS